MRERTSGSIRMPSNSPVSIPVYGGKTQRSQKTLTLWGPGQGEPTTEAVLPAGRRVNEGESLHSLKVLEVAILIATSFIRSREPSNHRTVRRRWFKSDLEAAVAATGQALETHNQIGPSHESGASQFQSCLFSRRLFF